MSKLAKLKLFACIYSEGYIELGLNMCQSLKKIILKSVMCLTNGSTSAADLKHY